MCKIISRTPCSQGGTTVTTTSGALTITKIVQKIKIITTTTVSGTTKTFGVKIIINKIIILGTTHKTLEIDAGIVIIIIV